MGLNWKSRPNVLLPPLPSSPEIGPVNKISRGLCLSWLIFVYLCLQLARPLDGRLRFWLSGCAASSACKRHLGKAGPAQRKILHTAHHSPQGPSEPGDSPRLQPLRKPRRPGDRRGSELGTVELQSSAVALGVPCLLKSVEDRLPTLEALLPASFPVQAPTGAMPTLQSQLQGPEKIDEGCKRRSQAACTLRS